MPAGAGRPRVAGPLTCRSVNSKSTLVSFRSRRQPVNLRLAAHCRRMPVNCDARALRMQRTLILLSLLVSVALVVSGLLANPNASALRELGTGSIAHRFEATVLVILLFLVACWPWLLALARASSVARYWSAVPAAGSTQLSMQCGIEARSNPMTPNQADPRDMPVATRVRGRGLGLALAVAGLLMLSGFSLMGVPGVYIFMAGDYPFGRYLGKVHGDNILEIGFWTNMLWPPVIPVALLLVHRVFPGPANTEAFPSSLSRKFGAPSLFMAILYAWAVVLAALFHHLAEELFR